MVVKLANTARTSFSNSCPDCSKRQRMRCVRENSADFTQSPWHLQHSLEVPREQRKVCIFRAACNIRHSWIVRQHVRSCKLRGKSSNGVGCLCWLVNTYEKITFLVLIWQELQSVKPVKTLVSGSSLIVPWFFFANYLSQWEDPISFWKLLTAFAEKCPNLVQIPL